MLHHMHVERHEVSRENTNDQECNDHDAVQRQHWGNPKFIPQTCLDDASKKERSRSGDWNDKPAEDPAHCIVKYVDIRPAADHDFSWKSVVEKGAKGERLCRRSCVTDVVERDAEDREDVDDCLSSQSSRNQPKKDVQHSLDSNVRRRFLTPIIGLRCRRKRIGGGTFWVSGRSIAFGGATVAHHFRP